MTSRRPLHRFRLARLRLAVALVLGTALLVACGGDDDDSPESEPVVLHGKTETGMALEVEPDVDPAEDPILADLDAYREDVGAPPVLYTRVTADNGDGDTADQGRVLNIATSTETLFEEGSFQLRFSCEALELEWIPPRGDNALLATWQDLQTGLCANGPPEPDGIGPGEEQTYYLIIEQGIETQDLAGMRFFGPRNEELLPEAAGSGS